MGQLVLVATLCLLATAPAFAHKFPVIEYSYVGHLWEASYTTIPRQPVIGEQIILQARVEHPNKDGPPLPISGNVTMRFSVYQDDTVWEWYSGKSYKRPSWQLLHRSEISSYDERTFSTPVTIDRVGSYVVTVDYYQNTQYIGQSMHTLDVEQRTLGPMFLIFSAVIIVAVLFGVWRGIL